MSCFRLQAIENVCFVDTESLNSLADELVGYSTTSRTQKETSRIPLVGHDLGHARSHICSGEHWVVGCEHKVVEFFGDLARQQEARDNHTNEEGASYK